MRKLNGYQALWVARSRAAADDYSRMARQKCVMNAMLQQLSPTTVITKFEGLTKATKGLIKTNLPASQLGKFAELAMKARSQPMRTVSFVPPAINTGDPDIDKIRDMIEQATDGKAAGGSGKKAATKGFTRDHAATTGASKGDYHSGYSANESQDLTGSC